MFSKPLRYATFLDSTLKFTLKKNNFTQKPNLDNETAGTGQIRHHNSTTQIHSSEANWCV